MSPHTSLHFIKWVQPALIATQPTIGFNAQTADAESATHAAKQLMEHREEPQMSALHAVKQTH